MQQSENHRKKRKKTDVLIVDNSKKVIAYIICLCVKNATGTAYFDDIQLEEGETPSTYNLLESLDTWTLGEGCQIFNRIPCSKNEEKIYISIVHFMLSII